MTAHVDPTGQHAIYAPSSAHRWSICTASATAIATLGPQEEGEEAAEGTAAHEEIERILGPYSGDGLGLWVERSEYLPVNPEHPAAYGISLVVSYVKQLPPGTLWIEQRVRLTDEIWGRCDVAHWDETSATLTIVDYKNGYVGVDAEDNEQLQIYAAATIYTRNLPARWVRLVVVQPNDFRPVPRVKQHVMSAEALYEFAKRVAAIPHGRLTFVAGEHCRYCPLFGRCEPTRDLLAHLSVALQHTADEVQPAQVATFKALQKPIEDWFKALDKSATKRALAGTAIPGMKLVATTKHRAWKDPAYARTVVVSALGDKALDLCTPAQAEKLGMKEDQVAHLSERPDGGPALAFESDKRPKWERKSAAEMFAGVVPATESKS